MATYLLSNQTEILPQWSFRKSWHFYLPAWILLQEQQWSCCRSPPFFWRRKTHHFRLFRLVSLGYMAWYNICLHTHLPNKPEINLTLMAPKSAPTANMETIRDQIIVTVCGCGGSSYLSYQLVLMKRCIYCGDRSKLLLNVIQIIETEWRRNDEGDVSHRRRRTQSSDMEADLKASS